MEILVLVIVALAALAVGVPIGIALCCGLVALSLGFGTIDLSFISQAMYTGQESLPILAVPCFMLAGDIMQRGGLTDRLVAIARKLTGHQAGGLGNVTIVASLFFGAISGSAPATTSAIGGNMIPAMEKEGHYDKAYATGLASIAGALGIIIPPSIPFVVFASVTSASVGSLFIAGVIPGIIVALALIFTHTIQAKHRGYVDKQPRASFKEVMKSIWDGRFAVLMPIIILGGIYGGFFTPTEASVVAIFYSLIVGFFVYKELKWSDVFSILDNTASFVGGVMLAFAPAAALGAVLTMLNVPAMVSHLLLSITDNIYIIMLIVIVVLLGAGMILDTISAIVVFAPILAKVLIPMGIDPLHLGVIMVVDLAIGFVTPPVAQNLFVASSMTGLPIHGIVKKALPFILTMLIALLLITFFPEISLALGKGLALLKG